MVSMTPDIPAIRERAEAATPSTDPSWVFDFLRAKLEIWAEKFTGGPDEARECLAALDTVQAELNRLHDELAPFLPMSAEEAEAALDAISDQDCGGVTAQEVESMVKHATDAEYRAGVLWERFCAMRQIARGLRTEVSLYEAMKEGVAVRIADLEAERDEALAIVASVARMLGWMNVPPRESIERNLSANRQRLENAEAEVALLTERLASVRTKLETIVDTSEIDGGVILISDYSPAHPEIVNGREVQVYEHEHFSELGDALIEVWKMTEPKGEQSCQTR